MKISVVIIAKNAEKTIATCISSILKQTYPPHEIIVVDGHSTDKTREVASQFPVRIVPSPKKHTYGISRNIGVKAAKGDIIAFLDTDDSADPKWLENVQETFRDAKVGVMNSNRIYTYKKNWFTDLKWNRLQKQRKKTLRRSKAWRDFGTSGSAFRKELIEKAGYFDEDMFFNTEDKELAIRIMNMGYDILTVPESIISFEPASSVGEWLREGFYRHGLGHGTIRRRYGKFDPPIRTPLVTTVIGVCFVLSLVFSFWELGLLLFLISLLGIFIKSYIIFRKAGKAIHSFVYTICQMLVRNLEFWGFVIGYAIPARVLRIIARR